MTNRLGNIVGLLLLSFTFFAFIYSDTIPVGKEDRKTSESIHRSLNSDHMNAESSWLATYDNGSLEDADGDGLLNTEESVYTRLSDVQGLPAGVYAFDFGDGPFHAYVDEAGWVLWLQYHHRGETNPALHVIGGGEHLPIYDAAGLGTDNSTDLSKWGHGSQRFAASIPDEKIRLRWYGETSGHDRIIHFESHALGDFQKNKLGNFLLRLPNNVKSNAILQPDHSANLPLSTNAANDNKGDFSLTHSPFSTSSRYHWIVKGSGNRWEVDDYAKGSQNHTLHRVWVKSDDIPQNSSAYDVDQDGLPNVVDSDSDNDGIEDGTDGCPFDANNDMDQDGICGDKDICMGFDDKLDSDEDGIPDGCDFCMNDGSTPRASLLYDMEQEAVLGSQAIIDATSHTNASLANTDNGLPVTIRGAAVHSLSAWDFSQTDSYLTIASNTSLSQIGNTSITQGITIGFWVNIAFLSSHEFRRIAGLGEVFDIVLLNEGIEFRFDGQSHTIRSSSTDKLLDGSWQHVAVTLDFTSNTHNLVLYLNGLPIHKASTQITNSFHTATQNLVIGASNKGENPFPGQLDDFILFDKGLCIQEVETLYTEGTFRFVDANTYAYAPKSKVGGYDYHWESYNKDPNTGICDQEITYEYTGVNSITHAPPVGVHPRLYFNPHQIPEIKDRLLNTKSGQAALAQIHAFTTLLNLDKYNRGADYAKDEFGNRRIGNTGYWGSGNKVYNQLVNEDTTFQGTDAKGGWILGSIMSLEAFESLIFSGEYDTDTERFYDDRAADLAKALTFWAKKAIEIYEVNPQAERPYAGFPVQELSIVYDLTHHAMSREQRDMVRKAISLHIVEKDQKFYGDSLSCYAMTSNWTTLVVSEILPNLVIEGEPGYKPALTREWMRGLHNFLTHGWYPSGASYEGIGKNQQCATMLIAASKRGYSMLGHPSVRNFGKKFLPAITQPFGSYFSGYSLWSGSGPAAVRGGYKFNSTDAVGLKWAYPDDKGVDFMWRNFIYQNKNISSYGYVYQHIAPSNGYFNFLVAAGAYALDYEPVDFNSAASTGLSLNYFASDRGVAIFRSALDSLAMFTDFHCRQGTGGHTMADRNGFTLSSLGRIWVRKLYYGTGGRPHRTRYHNTLLIDDVGLGKENIPGKIIDYEVSQDLSTVTGDVTFAYSHELNEYEGLEKENPLLGKDGWEKMTETFNEFQYLPQSGNRYHIPMYDFPNWRYSGIKSRMVKRQFRPMERVIRSVAMVRGKHPFLLVVDDVQADEMVHNYKWALQLDLDLYIEKSQVNLEENTYQNDIIITEPEESGNRRLLTRILNNSDSTLTAKDAFLERIDPKDHDFAEPVTADNAESIRRLVIESNSIAPNYRIMLFPHYEGDTLPQTIWNNQKDTLWVTFANEVKVIALNSQNEGQWNKVELVAACTAGAPCDDGDSCTVNDRYEANCKCVGTMLDEDNDGFCAAADCDDNDPEVGQLQEAGTACDDGDPSTVNDMIQADGCSCLGGQKKSLGLRMYMEGPYDPASGLMHDSLRQKKLLPLEDPYGLGEMVNPSLLEEEGADAVVGWIQVEVRDKVDPSTILTSAAMLLQRDGDLITADGDSLLSLAVDQDSAYLTVSHWNHLSLTTALPIQLADTASIDFSQPATAVYGGVDAGKLVEETRLLLAGDANGDGSINEVDKNQHWRLENGTSTIYGASQADFNLDGVINIVDRNEYWKVNVGKVSQDP